MSTSNKSDRVTLTKIANVLNLHVSTVSRVLNASQHEALLAASPKTVERIRALARELNYQTNQNAASLRTKRSNSIGVLVPRLTDIVLATIYEGIDQAASRHGKVTFVSNTENDLDNQRRLGEIALARQVDGLIIGDAHVGLQSYLYELENRSVPFVLVSRGAENFCSVTCDDYLGGELVAEHFYENGHQRLAVASGEDFAITGINRSTGFIHYLQSRGIDVPANWNVSSGFDTRSGFEVGMQLLSQNVRPTAIFAVNDFLAIGIMGAARKLGLTVGLDIAVVGYNDTPLAEHLPISLSSVYSPLRQMGSVAYEMLQNKIDKKPSYTQVLKPRLNVRESSTGVKLMD
ncbi:substrate-binding domain-containing protein [Vibrio alginolyticus]|uniref:LacI family DNA-binding transcriptional regulator n=1 Tax=Vibrio alginolyticus TaxID=663 RepID=UPI002F40AADB